MLDSPMFQIALAILLVFLIMAALVSLVQQFIVQGFRMRARNLRRSIFKMLRDDTYKDEIAKRFYRHPLTAALSGGKAEASTMDAPTFIAALASAVQPAWMSGDPVANLPASVAALRDGELKDRLALVLPPPGATREDVCAAVTGWFGNFEKKMSERFKADCVALSYGVAFVLTVLFNVSTIEIVQRLRTDDQMRAAFASVAPELATSVYSQQQAAHLALASGPPPAPGADDPAASADVQAAASPSVLNVQQAGALLTVFECAQGNSDLPIGWGQMWEWIGELRSARAQQNPCAAAVERAQANPALAARLADLQVRAPQQAAAAVGADTHLYGPDFKRNGVLEVLAGWLITVLAAAQGAPFWFNAIRRIAGR